MKAIVVDRYGSPDVLQMKEVTKPVPEDNEVLIKIQATAVTSGNSRLRSMNFPIMAWLPVRIMFGFTGPRKNILGSQFAGEVEAVGKAVTRFKPGDQVFGVNGRTFGAYAEYLSLPEDRLVTTKPANLTFEEAVAIPFGALTALEFLQKANIQPEQKVLIYGASGSVGTAAVQLAKDLGAEVTGVCSTGNIDLVTSLGADHVVDYTQEDFAQRGETYDVIFDAVGKTSSSRSKRALEPGGMFLSVTTMTHPTTDMLEVIKELAEAGKIRPVIDRRYPLEQIADAHRYVDSGHKKGNVVITVAQS